MTPALTATFCALVALFIVFFSPLFRVANHDFDYHLSMCGTRKRDQTGLGRTKLESIVDAVFLTLFLSCEQMSVPTLVSSNTTTQR